MDTRRTDLLLKREKMKNDLEVKILLKSAKLNSNVINYRNQRREKLNNNFLKREERLKNAKINSGIAVLKKINLIKHRQMSRDIRDIQYKFNSINPNIDIYDSIKEKNKQKNYNNNYNKINYYSYDRRKYNDEKKNKFFEKYNSLKWDNNINNIIYELDNMKNDFIYDNMIKKDNNYNYYRQIDYYNNEKNQNFNITNNPLSLLPIIDNKKYNKEIIKIDDNKNVIDENENKYSNEEERKIKLQKIMDSYKNQ